MSLLVLHAGAESCDGGVVQQELGVLADQLAGSGVIVPSAREPREWRELSLGLVRDDASQSAAGLLEQLGADPSAVAVVSSDALCDALHGPKRTEAFAQRMRERAIDVRVVVFVREQIGFINTLYTKRLLNLDTSQGFPEFVSDPVPPHRFDFAASYSAVADTEGLSLTAVPYPELATTGPTRALLQAAGVDASVLDSLPPTGVATELVAGPVLVAATRLLHKRMRRNKMFELRTKAELRVVARRLRAEADEREWDSDTFWGWDDEMAGEVVEEYRPSNEMFAEFVWGHGWEEPFSSAPQRVVDLPALDPDTLRDVIDTVDALVRETVETKPAQPEAAQAEPTRAQSDETQSEETQSED